MPCLPLDGATVVVSGLVGCGLRPLTAAKVVVALSCVSLAMVAACVLIALFSRTLHPSVPLLTFVRLLWKTYHLYRACGDGAAAVGKHALFKDLPIPTDETTSGLQPLVGSAAPPPPARRRRREQTPAAVVAAAAAAVAVAAATAPARRWRPSGGDRRGVAAAKVRF